MIDKQFSLERFTFACHDCEHTWSVDYGVQHVEDGHGHTREYFLRHGLPVVNPAGAHSVLCPRCSRDRIDARPGPRSAAFRAAERARERRRRVARWTAVAVGAAVVIAGIAIGVVASRGSSGHAPSSGGSDVASATLTGPAGPEGIVLEQAPVLAPASAAASGQTVDGIQCNSMEQAVYHIHTHLTVYVDGALRAVPAGVGVVQPVPQQTNNGRQALTTSQVGPAHGAVTAFVNGRRYTGDPAAIPLDSHEDVQLDVGSPDVAAKKVDWSRAQL